jgi:enoyl-CoA hydratase/carnithine racemase
MEFREILVKTGGVYEIIMSRPNDENRLTNRSMEEIVTALEMAAEDKKCYAVIFGASGNVFCFGGGQLNDYRIDTSMDILQFGRHFIKLHTAFGRCPKPVICAIEGEAIGGGFSLIEACDLAVCAEEALISISEMAGGLAPAMGTSGLYKEMSKKRVMELGLLSRKLSAAEAHDYGMLNKVVPKSQVMKAAREMAEQFREKNPTSIAMFKEMYRQMGQYDYERRMESAQSLLVAMFKSLKTKVANRFGNDMEA